MIWLPQKRRRPWRYSERVLREIKPTKEELQHSVFLVNELTTRSRAIVPSTVEVRAAGSIVRSTHLRGSSDIDIFLLFSKKLSRERIMKDGLAYAKKMLRSKTDTCEIKYAEHPYTRLYLNSLNIEADIVPAYKIENIEDMATAVDRSPMHAEFMIAHLTENLRDDVRLLKYFLAKHNIYGAEVSTGGFSGYLCELLVYHFGSLLDLFKSVSEFKLPVVINPGKQDALDSAALVKKFNSQFIVIDPVDPNRNVAAAVSTESLARFAALSKIFLDDPQLCLFSEHKFSSSKIRAMMDKFLSDSGTDLSSGQKSLTESEDVIWPLSQEGCRSDKGPFREVRFQDLPKHSDGARYRGTPSCSWRRRKG